MNVGIFTDPYKPNINGVVTSIVTKKEELEKLGYKVYIIAPYEPGYEEKDPDVIRMKSFKLIFQPEYRLSYPPSRKMLNEIKKLNLDIIHSETPFSLGLIAKYIAKKSKLPLIHTYHTLFPQYVHYLKLPTGITRKMAEKASAMYCNFCNHIIAPSTEVKNELLRYGVKKEISVIPTGVNINSFLGEIEGNEREIIRTSYNIKKDEKLLLYVGRLGKEKNIDFLLDVLYKLKSNSNKKIKLMLVGDGPYRESLQKKVKKYDLTDNVIFVGYVERKRIAGFYRGADLFVFSSLTETQGLVILEAMAASLPVVAVKASGVEDMVEDGITGYLTQNDIEQFVEKVKELIVNKEIYEKFAINSHERADQFNPEKVIEKMNLIYKDINSQKIRLRMRKAIKYKKRADKFLGKFRRRKKDRYNKKYTRVYPKE